MLESLVPLLILVLVVIKILDYLDALDLAVTAVSLIVGAIALKARLFARLIRSQFGADVPRSRA
jgi:hypothetical protein